ncbi:MAG: carotenoid 1,2-hydratase [Krumholzibacteria bacterium]|nr:carotenoid 1,2-hydratase [Candidatus Krumholzibacteria bacterium]
MRRFVLLIVLGAAALAPAGEPGWRQAAPGYPWSFPRDHHAHPDYKTEWWYVTGHLAVLAEPDAEPLAFQQTFFRIGLAADAPADSASRWAARDLVMGHAAVGDPARGRHVFSEVLWRAVPLLGGFGAPGDPVLAWAQAPAGTPGRWSLALEDGGFRLTARDDRRGLRYDLLAVPTRPLVLHGEGGFSPKTADGTAGSLYFSATRLEVTGTVWQQGAPLAVGGQAWLDREIFTSTLAADQTGWDWLSLQLDDGRDLMLYRLRGPDGRAAFALGTLVTADGTARTLPGDAWSWEPGRTWTSDRTGSTYPVSWRLQVPAADLDLRLEATLDAQENVSGRTGVHYWEGAVRARTPAGAAAGRGFIELTGYGEGSRPPV